MFKWVRRAEVVAVGADTITVDDGLGSGPLVWAVPEYRRSVLAQFRAGMTVVVAWAAFGAYIRPDGRPDLELDCRNARRAEGV